jgi:hypothetical protein
MALFLNLVNSSHILKLALLHANITEEDESSFEQPSSPVMIRSADMLRKERFLLIVTSLGYG